MKKILFILMFVLFCGAVLGTDITSNLELFMSFNNSIADFSPNSISTVHSGVPNYTFDQNGTAQEAIYFNGSEYILVGVDSTFSRLCNNGCSIVVWVNSSASHNGVTIARYDTTNDRRSFRLRLRSDNTIEGNFYEDGTTTPSADVQVAGYVNNEWEMITLLYNGSNTTQGNAILYANTTKIGTSVNTCTIDDAGWSTAETPLVAAEDDDAFINKLNGAISEIRLYSRVLSEDDITALYTGLLDVPTVKSNLSLYTNINTNFNLNVNFTNIGSTVQCGAYTNDTRLVCSNESHINNISIVPCESSVSMEASINVTPFCFNSTNSFNATSGIIFWDNIFPKITIHSPNPDNSSRILNVSLTVFNITVNDTNLYGINLTCYNGSGTSEYSNQMVDLVGSSFTFLNSTLFTNVGNKRCVFQVADDHTANKWTAKAEVKRKFLGLFGEDKIVFNDGEIEFVYDDRNNLKLDDIVLEFKTDRISPILKFKNNPKDSKIYWTVRYNGKTHSREEYSNIKGHIVILPDGDLRRGYWYDAEDEENSDVNFEIFDDEIRYEADIRDFDGVYKTKSLGGININQTTFNITIIPGVNLTFSAHNTWNNTGILFNFTETNVSGTFSQITNYVNIQRNTTLKTFEIFNDSYMNSYSFNFADDLSRDFNLSFYQAVANVNVLTNVSGNLITGSNITANSSSITNNSEAPLGFRTFYVDATTTTFNASNPSPLYGLSNINTTTFSLGDNLTINLEMNFNGTINFTIFDAETLELITTENITIDLFNSEQSFTKQLITITGTNTTDEIPEGLLRITASGDTYNTAVKFLTIDSQNFTQNVSMYLLNESDPDVGNLFVLVFNQDFYAIKNADTRLLQFFPEEGEFIEVEQCFSNSNGECVFNIILGEVRYIITTRAVIEGEILTASSSEVGNFYPIDNTEIELYIRSQGVYSVPDDFGLVVTPHNTSLIGNTSYMYAEFIDIYGNDHTICLGYYFNDGFQQVLGSENCTTGTSGTVGFGTTYVLDRDFTWAAEIYSRINGNKSITYYSITYNKTDSFQQEYDIYLYPLLIFIMSILLGMGIQLKNIIIFPIGMIPTLLFYSFLKSQVFTPLIVGVLIFFCIILIYIGRKKSDNEAT